MNSTRLAVLDRCRAWLVTGPPGRGIAFVLDWLVAVWRLLLRRQPDERSR